MANEGRGPIRRFIDAIIGFLPDGGVDDEAPPPDIDGRRDTDNAQKQAVLRAKSQLTLHGGGTTSYQTVERGPDPES
jgi:hypothetical protein